MVGRCKKYWGEWKEAFEKHGLKMSMEKTEVKWVKQQRK